MMLDRDGVRRFINTTKEKGRYEILGHLGSGGMAEVFRAKDHSTGQEVAMKFPHEAIYDENDPEPLKRFSKEIKVLWSLNHPAIVRCLDFGLDEDTGQIFYVMELFESEELSARIERLADTRKGAPIEGSLLPMPQLSDAVNQLLDALQGIHELGLVHRDIKPSNVLVRDGANGRLEVKLADFGVVRSLRWCSLSSLEKDSKITQEPKVIGTPHYFSPEHLYDPENLDTRSDLYGVGTIIFEAVTGEQSVDTRGTDLPFHKLIHDLAAPFNRNRYPSRFVRNMNPELERWILKLLERRPCDRFQTAREARDAFNRIFDVLVPKPVVRLRPSPLPSPPAPSSISVRLVLGIAAALLACIAGIAVVSSSPSAESPVAAPHAPSYSRADGPDAAPPQPAPVKVEDLPPADQKTYRVTAKAVQALPRKQACPPHLKARMLALATRHPRFPDPYSLLAACAERERKPAEAAKHRQLFQDLGGRSVSN